RDPRGGLMRIRRWARWSGVVAFALTLGSGLAAPRGATAKSKRSTPKMEVSSRQAEKTALQKYPGKLAGKTELENEDGKWQYAVMVRSGKKLLEVQVDAHTGKIVDTEETTAAEEARE